MGTNTIPSATDGTTIPASHHNSLVEALEVDLVPRNSSSVATTRGGSLGTSGLFWLKAHIASGSFSAGMFMYLYDYNGTLTIPQGWFICNGAIINETNYENQVDKTLGDWDTFIGTSPLEGLYAPNLDNKYIVGETSSFSTDGTAPLTYTGNAAHSADISHTHSHNHQWYDAGSSAAANNTFLANGSTVALSANRESVAATPDYDALNPDKGIATIGLDDSYTNTDATTGGSTKDVQPESLKCWPLIRII